ncbi:MAG: hypothetical protein AMR96_05045 [Candidatus Adiutrix intracellularis]|nr:MAG: hypothetical protein AMR96_05045 [Candidatus Adiutrix intracellularis]
MVESIAVGYKLAHKINLVVQEANGSLFLRVGGLQVIQNVAVYDKVMKNCFWVFDPNLGLESGIDLLVVALVKKF